MKTTDIDLITRFVSDGGGVLISASYRRRDVVSHSMDVWAKDWKINKYVRRTVHISLPDRKDYSTSNSLESS